MPRIPFPRKCLENLRGNISSNSLAYMSKERAYEKLKARTGQDYGYDADAWEKYFRNERRKRFIRKIWAMLTGWAK